MVYNSKTESFAGFTIAVWRKFRNRVNTNNDFGQLRFEIVDYFRFSWVLL